MKFFSLIIVAAFCLQTTSVFAATESFRWTGSDDKNAEFSHVLEVLSLKSKIQLSASDFLLVEDRDLANNKFLMFVQVVAGIPVSETSVRLWTDFKTGELIQAEASIETPETLQKLGLLLKPSFVNAFFKSPAQQKSILNLVKAKIRTHRDDKRIRDIKSRDVFENGALLRIFTVKAKHGVHTVKFSLSKNKIISHTYEEFPNADLADADDEFSIPALVYPIYEETESLSRQQRVLAQLTHLKKKSVRATTDLYAPLLTRHYFEEDLDPILGLTAAGQAKGSWAMSDIKQRATQLRAQAKASDNSFAKGMILEGRYATISIHPDASVIFKNLSFKPKKSSIFYPQWKDASTADHEAWEMVPGSGFLGKPLTSFVDAFERPAERLADHNPSAYINAGFDEIQVYYAINTLFDSLHLMGFTDPELSTRPFHAFMYDLDIGMKDNAYYTDDTINFTTYSNESQNYARDNSTIWHELGHGIMDRLMGDHLRLADTGGLSEGMADFVAALVIEQVTSGIPFEGSNNFRIINKMGFHLTNEVHDDGESYGGAMRDILEAAKIKLGKDAVMKVGDLTMETMRLTRNHPGLTAEEWFSHMLFADELGHAPVRGSGELKDLILQSLADRNFVFGAQKPAQFLIINNGKAVESRTPGSRQNPIPVTLTAAETAVFQLQIKVEDGELYKYKFPLTVTVQYEGGPLQGALHWEGQENTSQDFVLNSASDLLNVELKVKGTCDFVNREDGSCNDFTYVKVLQAGSKDPIAKKRFYVRLTPKP